VIEYMSAPEKKRLPPNAVLVGFARKAIKTLEGIQLLAKNESWEEAQVLTRVIFELRATFDCFWDMWMAKPEDACRRVLDAMMLEKMKQIRSYTNKDFQEGVGRPVWDTAIDEISSRYPAAELEAMKKNGFTGISVEARCQKAGHGHVYQIMYRNLSRNVHATDFVEQIGELVFDEAYLSRYRRVRNHTVLFIGNWSAGGIMIRTDIDKQGKAEIRALQDKQKQLMEIFKTFAAPGEDA